MAKSRKLSVGRRGFLKGAAAGAAALAGGLAFAQGQQAAAGTAAGGAADPAECSAETSVGASADIQIIEHPGSDYMVDVIKSLPIDYIFASPGSSFRSLHESVVNYRSEEHTSELQSL